MSDFFHDAAFILMGMASGWALCYCVARKTVDSADRLISQLRSNLELSTSAIKERERQVELWKDDYTSTFKDYAKVCEERKELLADVNELQDNLMEASRQLEETTKKLKYTHEELIHAEKKYETLWQQAKTKQECFDAMMACTFKVADLKQINMAKDGDDE